MKPKKAKILSLYWFAILFLVAAAVVYMVVLFYGKPYDVREKEANILAFQIANCISETGVLRGDVFETEFREKILEECNLDFKAEDIYGWQEGSEYYFEIEFFSFDKDAGEMQSLNYKIENGNVNLKDSCGKKGENLAVCIEKSFYTLGNNNEYVIKILSAVRKTEKNV